MRRSECCNKCKNIKFSKLASFTIQYLLNKCNHIFHLVRGEAKDIGFNIFMLLLAIFVIWGRM